MTLTTIRNLGSGGFGTVDLVQDAAGHLFALKRFSINQPIHPSLVDNVRKRFVREAKLQAGLNHRNIVPILSHNLASDPPYYFMPVADSTLEGDIASQKTLGGNFLGATNDIIAGLEELHSMEMCHRDLKPQNVLRFVDPSSQQNFYAISDFGFISLKDSRLSVLTKTGMKRGADFYTAPEVTTDLRNASAQSDIYSLGCILHDMIGREDRVPCGEIREDGEFAGILLSCTRSDPKRRFKSVAAVRDALASLDASAVVFQDARAEVFVELLDSQNQITADQFRSLVDYLDDQSGSTDAASILRKISSEKIAELCASFPEQALRLGIIFAKWIQDNAFDFDFCDALSSRLQAFIVSCSFEVKVDCLIAMLRLGTRHNRWYVERQFMALCGPTMNDQLAKRLAIEFRAGETDICAAISHLERSITTSRSHLHPILVQALGSICP